MLSVLVLNTNILPGLEKGFATKRMRKEYSMVNPQLITDLVMILLWNENQVNSINQHTGDSVFTHAHDYSNGKHVTDDAAQF
jgi:hypothetical protein